MTVVDDPLASLRVIEEGNLEELFEACLDELSVLPDSAVLGYVSRWTSKLAAVEAETLARSVADDGDTEAARRMLRSDRKTSRREKNRKTKRAKAAAKNPDLVDKMRDGELSAEQMDNIADATDKDPDAANDTELIDKVAATPPEQGRKIADEWVQDRKTRDQVQTEHQRQRGLRAVRKGVDPVTKLHTLLLEGDKASINEMFNTMSKDADELYQQDGGRDLALDKHPRTYVQRLFDAAHNVLTGAHTDHGRSSSGGRPAAVLALPLDRLTGDNPDQCTAIAGRGPIPDETAIRLLANSDLFIQITSDSTIKSQPLWQGRLTRTATAAQYIALAIRDSGCVTCSAPPERCHAHHLLPWNAPGQGETNIDELALQCPQCHTALHEANLTLHWDHTNQTWNTHPATPNETPPPRARKTSRGDPP